MTWTPGTERDVEIPWAIKNCTRFPVLDVGCRESVYHGDIKGEVHGLDVREHKRDGLDAFYKGDIRTWKGFRKYPTVLSVSSNEHVGLAVKSYETEADDVEFGDRRAVEGCMNNLADDGVFLMTVPAHEGEERRIVYDWYRSYNELGIADLLEGFDYSAEFIYNPTWPVGGVCLAEVRHLESSRKNKVQG